MGSKAALLVNLGSPDSPTEEDVRRYLNEFLMDGNVIDLPWPLRRLIVSLFVLPKRPAQSAEAYASVWTDEGSPLINISYKLLEQVRQYTDIPVELAMRYGRPDMESAIVKLASKPEIKELLLFPLYPHYAMSTVKTVIEKAQAIISDNQLPITLSVHPVFYDHDGYIDALVNSARPWLEKDYDHLIFSYHGVPERHITKDDPTNSHCLKSGDCCHKPSPAHHTCYRHQVYRTSASFVEKAGISVDKYSVSFQSKLGRDKWLEPSTLETIEQLAEQGAKKILVICPAFVSDCLETLEEIGMEAKEAFIKAGGESLELIPCLNDNPDWAKLVSGWLEQPLKA
ncbi:ferrochelatase [Endozoicomonas montiporae]|uniref:Ferrochelatase n=2 Tax=Endozoicomonas montiporae TaxID=1027273 RepID=A0A081N4H9_9GAMM|nr:ferrochelatase [Endozoicomonas montiporae]AMO57792.1 ferrochelatase, protoheme ferro-lyase [Endozoicomonas montiporae CL-33]KEQ13352.1 ferrochelatase [Endozoicomonas montiporae]